MPGCGISVFSFQEYSRGFSIVDRFSHGGQNKFRSLMAGYLSSDRMALEACRDVEKPNSSAIA